MGCGTSSSGEKEKKSNKLVMKKESQKQEIKVVFLGDAGVGKSSIAQRFCYNKISEAYDVTIGGVYHRKEITLSKGTTLTLHLWDTGGEERFRAMAPLYYRDANAAVLVYDVQDPKTLESLNYWLKELDEKVKSDGMVLCCAGNKCDVEGAQRKVSKQQGQGFAQSNDLIFQETSAVSNEGIQQLFKELAEKYVQKREQSQQASNK